MENKPLLTVLKSQSDFQRLKESGFRYRSAPWLLLNWSKTASSSQSLRCGWTISRKIGSAVVRNRLKRWCRYYLQTNKMFLELPVDLNIVFLEAGQGKSFFKSLRYDEFKESMDKFYSYLIRNRKVSVLVPN